MLRGGQFHCVKKKEKPDVMMAITRQRVTSGKSNGGIFRSRKRWGREKFHCVGKREARCGDGSLLANGFLPSRGSPIDGVRRGPSRPGPGFERHTPEWHDVGQLISHWHSSCLGGCGTIRIVGRATYSREYTAAAGVGIDQSGSYHAPALSHSAGGILR